MATKPPVTNGAPPAPAEPPREQRSRSSFTLFSALQYRNFRYLWLSSFFNSGAGTVQQLALSWLVYDLTGSTVILGLLASVSIIPFSITAPLAGALADRMDRRLLLLLAFGSLVVVATLFTVDVLLDTVKVWHIFVFSFLVGVGGGVANTVRLALVPSLVPRSDLLNATALSYASLTATQSFSPSLGGLLIDVIGMAGNFFAQIGCYVASWFAAFRIKLPQAAPAQATREPFRKSMLEGFRYLLVNRPVLSLILLALVPMLFVFPAQTLLPVFAKDVFDMGATGFGTLMTAVGVGSLIGTLWIGSFKSTQRKAPLLYSVLTIAIAMSVIFAWTRWLPAVFFVLCVQGAMQMAYISLNNATIQLMVPDKTRGRVMAVYMLGTAAMPLGSFVLGTIASAVGPSWALTIFGCTGIAFVGTAYIALSEVRKL